VRLRYTRQALLELDQTVADIAFHSPQGARRIQKRIQALATLLVRYPDVGQLTNLRSVRRLVVTPYPYLIFYRRTVDEVIIVGIRHGARDPSSFPGGK